MSTSTTPLAQFCTIDGLRIRYADSGGSHEQSILLTSPWPESLYCYARIWPALAEQARLFAVDLPGFGASGGRPDLLFPRAMGAFLARLVVEANLGAPHIVAPDVGTLAALFTAVQHPDRISSVIVGTGGAALPLQLGQAPASFAGNPARVPNHVRADYFACYGGDRFNASMRFATTYPDEVAALVELLPQITAPVTIVKSRHDGVVPLAKARRLVEALPNSRVVVVNAGHVVWEEAPMEYAAVIVDSLFEARRPTARAHALQAARLYTPVTGKRSPEVTWPYQLRVRASSEPTASDQGEQR